MSAIDTLGRPAIVNAALDLFARIGCDLAMVPDDLGPLTTGAREALPGLWAAYTRHWHGFCESRLDPLFSHLDHPARLAGSVRVTAAAPVVVVGTGPSLAAALPDLRRLRSGLHIVTSMRGAEAIAEAGIVPDLVLVEHQMALDAHFSLADRSHRRSRALTTAPLVAADPRTPAAILDGVQVDRLFVPDPLPTWGLWPATAVALALGGGAGSVGLVGIDLGSRSQPNPLHAPLRDVLGLLARSATVPCLDLSAAGARKAHWSHATVDEMAAGGAVAPLCLDARPWLSPATRLFRARQAWHRQAALVAHASTTLAAACDVRDGQTSSIACARMLDGLVQLVAAGTTIETRRDVQDLLGVAFLPRFWRTPPDRALGEQLWRAAALASHELVHQHRALGQRLERAA